MMKNKLYVGFLSVVLLMMLGACADRNSNSQNRLDENTEAGTDSESLRAEIEALQSELDALETEQTETPSSKVDSLLEDLLDGEWFNQSDFNGMLERLVFYADGTGSLLVTDYEWADSFGISSSDPNYTGEHMYNFTWSLDGNVISTVYNENWSSILNISEEKLQLVMEDGSVAIYAKIRPTIPESYVEVASLLEKTETFKQKFLGEWHFDVYKWKFHEDEMIVIDVPAFGQHPANQMEYPFSIMEDPLEMVDALLVIDHPTSGLVMYEATFGDQSGGSITLEPRHQGGSPILLTRSFDVRNNPITDEIVDQGMALFESFELFAMPRKIKR